MVAYTFKEPISLAVYNLQHLLQRLRYRASRALRTQRPQPQGPPQLSSQSTNSSSNMCASCFLAYTGSAPASHADSDLFGETGEVTRILRQLQTIALSAIHIKNQGLRALKCITKVPAELNAELRQA